MDDKKFLLLLNAYCSEIWGPFLSKSPASYFNAELVRNSFLSVQSMFLLFWLEDNESITTIKRELKERIEEKKNDSRKTVT